MLRRSALGSTSLGRGAETLDTAVACILGKALKRPLMAEAHQVMGDCDASRETSCDRRVCSESPTEVERCDAIGEVVEPLRTSPGSGGSESFQGRRIHVGDDDCSGDCWFCSGIPDSTAYFLPQQDSCLVLVCLSPDWTVLCRQAETLIQS
ncbi:unnamed protein product [Cuscuta epithymum]|uniref:Uncharacterized protein n=1 Tax=Cuscuta epithymum TaxID=186058 RepID=A0AAV0D4F5_9ASTE|nr:unnamed protein product [Cuscuta epithymum]